MQELLNNWENLTDEQRYKIALKIRRKIKKWVTDNPGKRPSETMQFIYVIARRSIKKKGKYEKEVEVNLGLKSANADSTPNQS